MNAEQLKKNVGQLLRLRPLPQFVVDDDYDAIALFPTRWRATPDQDTDFDWRLDEVTVEGVKLVCQSTGHKVTLGKDNVREYRSPNFLMLKCQLIIEGYKVRIEPF
jgi:hypothetical protein